MRPDRRELAAVFAGGFLGTIARAALADVLPVDPGRWPWSTLIVNLVGAFLLGYFATRLRDRPPRSAAWGPFLGSGLCGGLTTFSAMQLELLRLLDHARYGLAAAYAVISIAAGVLAVAAGANLGRGARGAG